MTLALNFFVFRVFQVGKSHSCLLYIIVKGGWVVLRPKKLTCQDRLTIFGPKVNQISCNKVTGFIISGSTQCKSTLTLIVAKNNACRFSVLKVSNEIINSNNSVYEKLSIKSSKIHSTMRPRSFSRKACESTENISSNCKLIRALTPL